MAIRPCVFLSIAAGCLLGSLSQVAAEERLLICHAGLITLHLGSAEGSEAPPGPQERISWGEDGYFGECVGPSSWCAATTTP